MEIQIQEGGRRPDEVKQSIRRTGEVSNSKPGEVFVRRLRGLTQIIFKRTLARSSMKLYYIGITDQDWFRFLRTQAAVEMNFWRPNSTNEFKAIAPGELFLFKLKYPANKIVGGGYLVKHVV